MINGLYGNFTNSQISDYKKKLHNKIHWLLIYKENNDTARLEQYFPSLLKQISALNEIVKYDSALIELLSVLQAAYTESQNEICDFKMYRKFILDAHSIVDKIYSEMEKGEV